MQRLCSIKDFILWKASKAAAVGDNLREENCCLVLIFQPCWLKWTIGNLDDILTGIFGTIQRKKSFKSDLTEWIEDRVFFLLDDLMKYNLFYML